ncbi:hypothetical protein FRC09_007588 [Ceratobasidium sp. 395]|nr:hypothetical protein FRC09_007588 [Ceratobasidium sp. 395]
MWTIYVAPLVYDSILFIMTVRRVWAMSKEYGSTPLMTRLAENGALHAGVLVVAVLFTCIGNKIESTKIASSGSSIFGAMPSVVCSRIMLSLHTLADREKQRYLPTTTGEGTTGSLRFGVPMQELNDASVTSLAIERFSFLQMEQ